MKKLVCGAAVGALLVFSVLGQAQAQTPVQPGTPPAAQTPAPPATPYVVPMTTAHAPIAVQTTPRAAKKPVHRQHRARSRSSSDNIANQLNAQELAPGGMAGPPAYGAPGYPDSAAAGHGAPGYPGSAAAGHGAPGYAGSAAPAYGAPGHPGQVAASGYPPPAYYPPQAYYPPPGPVWYPPPRPLFWRPWWRPWWY
jgi:hypothetical protein